LAEKPSQELVGHLLSLLAHDLRNPLSALHSNVGFLGAMVDRSNADATEAVADALLSCDGLGYIIDSLEMLSHVLSGSADFPKAPFRLGSLVSDAVSSCTSLARSHETNIKCSPACMEKLEQVFGNREMSLRALTALIRNAVQHAPPRSEVEVTSDLGGNVCRILVLDSGTPLARDLVDSAFTAEGQVSTKALRGGRYSRGLGLYCARVCADAAGATVAAHQPTAKTGSPRRSGLKLELKPWQDA
jgi:signal transduction histidine kinase